MASHSLSLGKNQRLKFTPSKGCLTILPIKPRETGLRHGLPRGWNAKFEAGMRYSPLLRNVHRSSFINLCSAQFSRGSLPKMGVYNYLETLLWEPTKLSNQNHSLSDWVGPQVYSVSLTAKNKHSLATKTDEATHELLAFRQKCAEHSWEGARIQAICCWSGKPLGIQRPMCFKLSTIPTSPKKLPYCQVGNQLEPGSILSGPK